jgi:hypothetical protein
MAAEIVSIDKDEPATPQDPRPGVYQMSLKTHNVLDYLLGVALILSPPVFGFSDVPAARSTCLNLGFAIIAYSLFTRYRWSIFKLIPIGLHMTFDIILGASLILAPWALGYRPLITGGQLLVHFVLGLGAILMVGVTRSRTEATIAREDREELKRAA